MAFIVYHFDHPLQGNIKCEAVHYSLDASKEALVSLANEMVNSLNSSRNNANIVESGNECYYSWSYGEGFKDEVLDFKFVNIYAKNIQINLGYLYNSCVSTLNLFRRLGIAYIDQPTETPQYQPVENLPPPAAYLDELKQVLDRYVPPTLDRIESLIHR